MTLPRLASLLALTAVVAACSSSGGGGGGENVSLVVGVQSQDFSVLGVTVDSVHVVATLDGAVISDQTLPATPALAKEIPVTGAVGARLEVVMDANVASAIVSTKRQATLLTTSPTKKLLRVQLETQCLTLPPVGSSIPAAPTCAAPQTCSAGRCVDETVAPSALEDYEADWATSPPDICRPANHGAPDVTEGTGQTDYLPLSDGQTLQLERGPQGGHHIWIATRMKNLRQSGSVTQITATMPDAPSVVIPPAAYVFTFDPDEGNYCKLWGLRFQLDANAVDLTTSYQQFLGKRLAVTTTITDSTGASGTSTRTIQIGPELLCPDGTSSLTCD